MIRLKEIKKAFEDFAPLSLQESYDNSGLLIGDEEAEIQSALIALDVTEAVLDEAISKGCNLVISHHPLIFGNLKTVTSGTSTGKMIRKAVQYDIAVYALHTNLDNIAGGVNNILCDKLGIINRQVLKPLKGLLQKLVTFCPVEKAAEVRNAVFAAGAGFIGHYDCCSFNAAGEGTFRAGEGTNPYVGETGALHFENEVRIETVFPSYLRSKVVSAMIRSHPYEEVAYDIYNLDNTYAGAGAGMTGDLTADTDPREFLEKVKMTLGLGCIRHTPFTGKKVRKVAVCGGAGSFLIPDALASGADIFLTGDIRYHDFFVPENSMLLADIGHYESEQFTKELISTLLKKKFPTFAHFISETPTNPVNYL